MPTNRNINKCKYIETKIEVHRSNNCIIITQSNKYTDKKQTNKQANKQKTKQRKQTMQQANVYMYSSNSRQ